MNVYLRLVTLYAIMPAHGATALWLDLIERAWRARSVIWLSGVRRVGKTCLCQTLPEVEYFDCELPRVRRMLMDPQSFLDGLRGRRIVLDEIHRLSNPSELLKIAADHYPATRIVATGSSTLRKQYPEGENVVVSQDVDRAFSRTFGELKVRFEGLDAFSHSVAEELA